MVQATHVLSLVKTPRSRGTFRISNLPNRNIPSLPKWLADVTMLHAGSIPCGWSFGEEGAPGLRRRLAAAHHVFAYAALTDVDAQFEQLTVDAGRTPTGILPAHLADQISDLTANDRSTVLAAAHLPGPEQPKARTMPSHDRFGLDDDQCRAPVAPNARQPDPQ